MSYESAKQRYLELGVDTDKAIEKLLSTSLSIHCWQGDDVVGFDSKEALSGGIQTTGNYPGRARTPEELMSDLDFALKLIPGKKKAEPPRVLRNNSRGGVCRQRCDTSRAFCAMGEICKGKKHGYRL